MEERGNSGYIHGDTGYKTRTTNRILDVREEKRPKIICIDELDKMPEQFQEKLLNFMESGHIKVDQMRKQYDFKIKGAKVFAACNAITRLSVTGQDN
ncbi:MAG: AAA family ATPase [Candidatus Nitrosopolaris sp.]